MIRKGSCFRTCNVDKEHADLNRECKQDLGPESFHSNFPTGDLLKSVEMCKIEIWNHSCGHSDDKASNRHDGYCDKVTRIVAEIEFPCEACRERQQVTIIRRWRRERQLYLAELDDLERKEKPSGAAKDKLTCLHRRTIRALHALKIDDPYRGLTFQEQSVLKKTNGVLAVKSFFEERLSGYVSCFRN
ncbi:MAG: hypothetical protein Q9157_005500 [Trypethelium eluteriae]